MKINLSKKLEEYLEKNLISILILRVSFLTEGCILIKEPKIGIIGEDNMIKFKDCYKICNNGLTLFISDEFKEIFGTKEEFHLVLRGKIKKKIVLENFQPIIIRTCKA